ncbi:MAG: Ig-like domain-containing protein [Gemmatimonadota bacterium]|nr:Ig-like domain-containing protein [Gemmatimonadota bacterium]
MVLVLLSCGREQSTGPLRAAGGVARGLSFNAVFPASASMKAFASFIGFDRVRVLLKHADGSVALDTMVAFPANANAITLSFDVTLAPGTPAAGELMSLTLAYVNAKGDTVFRGGPASLRAAAAIEGAPPPPPVSIDVRYTGPGASATTLRISPRTLTVNGNAPFAFTAVASNAGGTAVPDAPIIWASLDSTLASIPLETAGAGTASAARGTARIVAQLFNGVMDTVTLNVIPLPTGIVVATGDNQVGIIGKPTPQPLALPIAVRVTAADGLGVPGVSVAFAAGNGGSINPATVVTDAAGLAQATWSLGITGAAQTATATVASLTGSSVTFNATAANKPATKLVMSSGPAASADIPAGTATPLVIAVQDADGDPATTYSGDVTVAIATNPSAGSLSGTATVAAVAGVASFPSISITTPGIGYVLQATSGTLSPVSTNAFNIVTGPAASLVLVSGGGQTADGGATLAPVKVLVTDASANPRAGVTVSFAPRAGSGTVTPTSAVTGADGTVATVWTLGAAVGTQTLVASTTGVADLSVTATATLSGLVARSVVSPRTDTLTSLGATSALSAQARDNGDNVVAGSFSWVSRNSSIATVSSGGVVTAVANGSTYVVALEIGGTRDSALMVVQQRVASVNITPASRSLYVTGTFTYTALAVDGRGNAMTSQPTFTWSSTSPTVASADAGTGLVTALSIGSTQIRATAGATIGVSVLTVQSPIKRILVSYDSVGAAAPDTFTMTALGLRRAYRAVARDTLDNVMTGVTFTWNSTNGSVAAIDAPAVATAGAISAANGVTSIQASAQGVTGSAALFVAQVLSSIELTPATASVGVGGSTALAARGKDSQNRYISGGSFTYASSGPSFASVNATTGVVTGVANGSANITAASGAITSNVSAITVSNVGVPPVITFGRDTIGVGRGASISVPILLSKPNGTNLVINLAAVDTNAYWATATVTVPAGATSVNATLQGRNAGTTRVSALDGSGAGYAGDTAVVAVQANMRLTTTYYSLNATDQLSTQVVLSDPSPAGGTYVTFSYGTAGRASVSPDPAFIPAGQLAADVVIRGIAAGSTTLTPLATGVSGTGATVVVTTSALSIQYTTIRLGAGQYEPNVYVSTPNQVSSPLVVSLTNSDSTIAVTAPTLTIPASNSSAYFEVNARAPGQETVTASATGWTPASLAVTVTTPKLSVCCAYTLNSSSPAQSLTIYTADSLGTVHYRQGSLAVRITSSDTTVLKVLDTLVTIAAGTYYGTTGRVIPNGGGGTVWVKVTAGGHTADSVKITVVGPALGFGYSTRRLGVGQIEPNGYVTIPNAISKSLVVTLTNSDSTIAATNATVTIPAGSSYAYFDLRGRGAGTNSIVASAAGYIPDTTATDVTTPRVKLAGGGSLNAYATYTTNVYSEDSVGTVHNRLSDLTVTLRSSDTTVIKVDTAVVIAAGAYYVPNGVLITSVSPGTAKIYVTAPGHLPDSVTWTVTPARLSLSWEQYTIGARQHQATGTFYAYLPNARDAAVTVTLTHSNAAAVALSSPTVTIPANATYSYFDLAGVLPGLDTVIATATGYVPDTAYVRVTTPRLVVASAPGSGTTSSPDATVALLIADSTAAGHYAKDTVVVRAVSSDTNVIKPTAEYFRIPKDSYVGSTGFQFRGPGTATITYSDSGGAAIAYTSATTYPVTVTGPALAIAGSNPGMLGTGQHSSVGSYYVYIPNAVGAPLKIALVSTDPRVATVPDTVVVPAGSYYTYFTITAQDTIGTVQIQATAVGYAPKSINMQVTKPQFTISTNNSLYTSSPPGYVYVYAADASGSNHLVNANVVVKLLSSAPGVAAIDSTTVTIVADNYYSNVARWTPGSVGTAQLSASDERAIRYPYTSGTANVSVTTPPAYLSIGTTSLGLGQYIDAYTSVPNVPSTPLAVPLTHAATPTTSTPSSVTIPATASSVYFRVQGTSTGADTITASPSGHIPAGGVVNVAPGIIAPIGGWPTSLVVGDSVLVTLYTRAPDGSTTHPVTAATTFTLGSDANIKFVMGGATITTAVVPADGYYVQFYVKAVAAGTASAVISNANYLTYNNTVTVNP